MVATWFGREVAGRRESDLQEDFRKGGISMSSPQYSMDDISGPGIKTLNWAYVFNRTYSLYAKNFWKYFRIGVVPAIIAYLCGYFLHILKREMLKGVPFQSNGWVPINLMNVWLTGA